MQITVKLFAAFKAAAGTGKLTLALNEPATLQDAVTALQTQFPNLSLTPSRTIFAINQEFAAPDTALNAGDELAIFPPVSGGSGQKFAISHGPVDINTVSQMVVQPHTGAVVTFTGIIRNVSEGKAVTNLTYEAYEAMAVTKMAQVAAEAREQWPDIVDVAIVQRIGDLVVGDVAVVIAVSSGHRNQGCFEACQYSINRLKEIVPIWKKEIGPDGETWIEGDHNPSLSEHP